MVIMRGPLLSITARGWLGRLHYAQLGFVACPYPIGLLGKIRVPYSLWDRGIHGTYRMSAWALRPYPGFICMYYSPKGWCYQMRRTWHGVIWDAMRPPISKQPNTPIQYAYKQVFASAVHAWQLLTLGEKMVYRYYRYPKYPSGYNRFLRWYLKTNLLGI